MLNSRLNSAAINAFPSGAARIVPTTVALPRPIIGKGLTLLPAPTYGWNALPAPTFGWSALPAPVYGWSALPAPVYGWNAQGDPEYGLVLESIE